VEASLGQDIMIPSNFIRMIDKGEKERGERGSYILLHPSALRRHRIQDSKSSDFELPIYYIRLP
jgi:hypothetical protein